VSHDVDNYVVVQQIKASLGDWSFEAREIADFSFSIFRDYFFIFRYLFDEVSTALLQYLTI
jgi:hypothetical protein